SYINAKIRARKSGLLTNEQWDALLGARDMIAALRILDMTGYSDLIKEFDSQVLPIEVEKTLQTHFGEVLIEITNDVPGSVQHLMNLISKMFQKEVVKTLLRLYTSESDQATAKRLLVPMSPFTLEILLDLVAASDIHVLISKLPDKFFRSILEEKLPKYEESRKLIVLEQALDKVVLQNLYGQCQRLNGLDKQTTTNLVGLEIDLVNLMIILRSQFLGIPSPEAGLLLLEPGYKLPCSLCRSAMQHETLEQRIRVLKESWYGSLVNQGWEAYEQSKSLHVFERIFHKHIQAVSQDMMLGYPFHFGVVLGYLNLKWYETLNLKALLNGKAENIESSIIRRTLIQ
ncbi:MAG: V-type ATPase subunit, partial [Promethearchaeota archaeon]